MTTHISLAGRRKRWALHQRELAHLVGVSPSIISRYERGTLSPPVKNLLALQVVFGRSGRHLFPEAYARVQDQVMRRAAKLDRALAHETDKASVRKRTLLSSMARRGDVARPA